VVLRKGSWEMPPVFSIILEKGGVPEPELYQVFNMGIGLTLIVSAESVDRVLKACLKQERPAWVVGEVTKGTRKVRLV
jgi:phosphoribosylformylglycinamidine cyclo-ligase